MSQAAVHFNLTSPAPALRRRVVDLWTLVESDMHKVETRLCQEMDSPIGRIPEVGKHLLDAGGKRLRPLLSVLAGRACGVDIDLAVAAGCAAELIHTATLFHDDVVDHGNVRRGRPAARMIFGNGVAVLVGDFCLARGLHLVASTGSVPMVQSLAATVTEMAEGEVAQLEGAGDPDATIASYLRVVDRKTASLMAWCTRVGGVLPEGQDGPLGRFGRALGRAFQIVDDILDCALDEGTTGKSGGRDLQEGKMTMPVLLACEVNPDLRVRIREALGEQGIPADRAQALLSAVRAAGGVERARRRALAYADEAAAELAALPESPHRAALGELCRLSVDRVE